MLVDGLVLAKSPIVDGKFISLISIQIENDKYVDIPILWDASQWDGIKLNQELVIDCIALKPKGAVLEYDEQHDRITDLSKYAVSGPGRELFSYEGTITYRQVCPDGIMTYYILDDSILVLGAPANIMKGATVTFYNLMPHQYQDLAFGRTFGELSIKQTLIFCPAISYVEGFPSSAEPLRYYPFKSFEAEIQSLLRCFYLTEYLLSEVVEYLCPAPKSPIDLFLDIFNGDLTYFDASIADPQTSFRLDRNVHFTDEYMQKIEELDWPLVFKVTRCPNTGVLQSTIPSNSTLEETFYVLVEDQLLEDPGLMVVKKGIVVRDLFWVDPHICRNVCRTYLIPTEYRLIQDVIKKRRADVPMYLVNVREVVKPHLERRTPVSMKGLIRGASLAILQPDGDGGWNARALDGLSIDIPYEPLHIYGAHILPGMFILVTKQYMRFDRIINIDFDGDLRKGQSRIEADTLFMSRKAYEHVTSKAIPLSVPSSVRDVCSMLSTDSVHDASLHVRGVVRSVTLESDFVEAEFTFLRLFELHSVGLPFTEGAFLIDLVDERDPSFSINLSIHISNTETMPFGVIPGALIECNQLRATRSDHIETTARSIIRVHHSTIKEIPATDIPFHYLSDYIGYWCQHPKTSLCCHISVLKILKLELHAQCRLCRDGPVERGCCVIHGKVKEEDSQLAGNLHFAVTDGTAEAEVHVEAIEAIFNLLKIDSTQKQQIHRHLLISGMVCFSEQVIGPIHLNLEDIKTSRYLLKGICLEAIRQSGASLMVFKRIQVGRQSIQVKVPPGKIVIKAVAIEEVRYGPGTRKLLEIIRDHH